MSGKVEYLFFIEGFWMFGWAEVKQIVAFCHYKYEVTGIPVMIEQLKDKDA